MSDGMRSLRRQTAHLARLPVFVSAPLGEHAGAENARHDLPLPRVARAGIGKILMHNGLQIHQNGILAVRDKIVLVRIRAIQPVERE